MGGDNGGGKGEGFSGTTIKDTWAKPRWVGIIGGRRDVWVGVRGGGKMETTVLEQQ